MDLCFCFSDSNFAAGQLRREYGQRAKSRSAKSATSLHCFFASTAHRNLPRLNDPPDGSATVSNDPTNDGVTWELVACQGNGSNCSAGVCTITPSGATPCGVLLNSSGQKVAHSASGDTLTYQLPSTFPLPGDALLVEIVALATYNQAVNVTAPITITAFGSVLQGTYVFQAQGNDSTGSTYPYQIAGQIYLDGSGNVTTPSGGTSPGQQTINTYDVNGNLVSTTTKITSGSYFVGTDGRGHVDSQHDR